MNRTEPPRTRPTAPRSTVLAVLSLMAALALAVTIAAALAVLPQASSTHQAGDAPADQGAGASTRPTALAPLPPSSYGTPRPPARASAPADDGHVRGDVSAFDDTTAAVTKLDPDLLGALRAAAQEADDDGVELLVTSGWRSAVYQAQLLREAVVEHGSQQEAARWVATPGTSAHVSGDAVDIGPAKAMTWLSRHGAAHGLCQIYRNEPWHFELRPAAIDDGCPAMYADPTQDPRMQH